MVIVVLKDWIVDPIDEEFETKDELRVVIDVANEELASENATSKFVILEANDALSSPPDSKYAASTVLILDANEEEVLTTVVFTDEILALK